MNQALSYQAVMAQRSEIMRKSVGIDYAQYESGRLAFDYERLLADSGYDIDAVSKVQQTTAVGNTPLVELHNIWLFQGPPCLPVDSRGEATRLLRCGGGDQR